VRLSNVEHRHTLKHRLILGVIRIMRGQRAPDIIRTLFYRSDYLGRPISEWTHAVMRGPSAWTVWERELFAAFTSRLNQCVF